MITHCFILGAVSPVMINIVGYLAAICMVCGYLPQAWHTIRTRDTDGIAMPTFLLLGFGSVFFVLQGLMINNWPLIITNLITTISSVIVFCIKLSNDMSKKRHGTRHKTPGIPKIIP
ncbi:MAG: SemiSWEET family transporter [Prevotella sp.]|nr:SemiSWEET family transporter [Prevotella sp.]MCM1074465.1 SemiSWEET family transporter [Ruminococcus sp.]